jgi:hypothetical protein
MEPDQKTAAATAAMDAKLDGILKVVSKRLPTKEEREESKTKPTSKPSSPDGDSPKSKGFLSMIKGLGSGLGGIASSFLKFGGFLLKATFFPITAISAMLTSTAALVAGLVAIGALFAGVAVASFMLTDDEFDKLKVKIAEGVAGVFSKIVEGAIGIYNKFVPDSFKVSEDDKKAMGTATFTSVKATIMGIIDFVKNVVDAFGTGFSTSMEGIKVKAKAFASKIGDVYEKIKGWMTSLGEKGKPGLMTYVELLGNALGKFVSGVLSVANFLADLIIDPQVTFAKFKASIANAFSSIGRTISDFVEGMFSKEGLLKMLQGFLGRDSMAMKLVEGKFGTVEEAAAEAAKARDVEAKAIQNRNKVISSRIIANQKLLDAETALGKDRNDERVKALAYEIESAKGDVEINKESLGRLAERKKSSQKLIIAEKVDKLMGEESLKIEKENEKIRRKIKKLEYDKLMNQSTGEKVGFQGLSGYGSSEIITPKDFREMIKTVTKMSGGTITAQDIASGNAKLTEEMMTSMITFQNIDADDIEKQSNQMEIFTAGLKRLSIINDKQIVIDAEKLKLTEGSAKVEEKRMELTTKAYKDAGFETYASQSGSLLNDAEATKKTMELAAQNKAGTAGTIVTDASSTSNVKNVTIVQKTGTNDGRGFK